MLFFTAAESTSGIELWKSNGSGSGTVRVAEIKPGGAGSDPSWLMNVNGTLFFAAGDVVHGRELWKWVIG